MHAYRRRILMTLEQLGWFLLINIPLSAIATGFVWWLEVLRKGPRY